MSESQARPGTTHLYTLKSDEEARPVDGIGFVVSGPHEPPFRVSADGTHVPVVWTCNPMRTPTINAGMLCGVWTAGDRESWLYSSGHTYTGKEMG